MADQERLPALLIIGAMKSGTTSLYMDLADHLGIYLAENKEPHHLCDDHVLSPAGRAAYADLYAKAQPHETLCDASTGYTKIPEHTGVVERATAVLPAGFKAIYVVRNPIERALSHYRHDHVAGTVGDDIDAELRRHPRYVDFGRYAMQLGPWLDALGSERVLVVSFERYVADRAKVLAGIADFLGLAPRIEDREPAKAYNQSKQKPRRNRAWDLVYESWLYRRVLRPLVPLKLRLRLFKLLLPKSDPTGLHASDETLAWLRAELAPDAAELAAVVGEPFWPELTGPAAPA
ncbi:MAG: sulfotransferase [Planctomycetota bacterium]